MAEVALTIESVTGLGKFFARHKSLLLFQGKNLTGDVRIELQTNALGTIVTEYKPVDAEVIFNFSTTLTADEHTIGKFW